MSNFDQYSDETLQKAAKHHAHEVSLYALNALVFKLNGDDVNEKEYLAKRERMQQHCKTLLLELSKRFVVRDRA